MNIYYPQSLPCGYYVYAYIRSKDSIHGKAGTPYYIGMGSGYRAWDINHHWVKCINFNYIAILETGLTQLGAFALERRYIQWYGRIDTGTGILRNKTDGGPGTNGHIRSKESIDAATAKNKGRKRHPDTGRKIREGRIKSGTLNTTSVESIEKRQATRVKNGTDMNSPLVKKKAKETKERNYFNKHKNNIKNIDKLIDLGYSSVSIASILNISFRLVRKLNKNYINKQFNCNKDYHSSLA